MVVRRHRRRGLKRSTVSGRYKGINGWLLRNWWLIPALIVLFGALAWVDPPPGSLGAIAGQSLGGNILDIRSSSSSSSSSSVSCKKDSDCSKKCSGGKCSKGKCSCPKGGILPSETKLQQATI